MMDWILPWMTTVIRIAWSLGTIELGDKTFCLACLYSHQTQQPWTVWVGFTLGMIGMTCISSWLSGFFFAYLSVETIERLTWWIYIAVCIHVLCWNEDDQPIPGEGVDLLDLERGKKDDDLVPVPFVVTGLKKWNRWTFVVCLCTPFVSEWGDRSQWMTLSFSSVSALLLIGSAAIGYAMSMGVAVWIGHAVPNRKWSVLKWLVIGNAVLYSLFK